MKPIHWLVVAGAFTLGGCHGAAPSDDSVKIYRGGGTQGKIVFDKAVPTATQAGKSAKPGEPKPIEPKKD